MRQRVRTRSQGVVCESLPDATTRCFGSREGQGRRFALVGATSWWRNTFPSPSGPRRPDTTSCWQPESRGSPGAPGRA